MNETNKNQHTQIQKEDKIHKDAKTLNSDNLRKNRKMIEKILPQEQKEKSTHRESSRLRNQPRKD